MVKRLVLALVVALVFLSPSTVFAEGCSDLQTTVSVSPASPKKGDTVNLSVNVSKVPAGYSIQSINSKPNSPELAQCAQNGSGWSCKVLNDTITSYAYNVIIRSSSTGETQTCYKSEAIITSKGSSNNINNGTGQTAPQNEPPGLPEIQILFGRAITALGVITFMALTVMLVVAGVKFITSGGEAKPLQQAQQTMTWAILGILFLVLAWLFLLMVARFTGRPDILQFNLKFG